MESPGRLWLLPEALRADRRDRTGRDTEADPAHRESQSQRESESESESESERERERERDGWIDR